MIIFKFFRWLITFVFEVFGYMFAMLAAFVLAGWVFHIMGWIPK